MGRRWHVYGFWADWVDYYYFKGDAEAFNPFLEEYAKLKDTPLKLVLHPGQGKAKRLGEKEGTLPFDWQVTVDCSGPKPEVAVDLWVGGQVECNKVNVPGNVKVESGGETGKSIPTGEEERTQEKETETRVQPTGPRFASKDVEGANPAPVVRTERLQAGRPVILRSERPRYVKVALNEDGSKTLLAVFDESQGTGKGYDVLYADANLNGTLEDAEKHKVEGYVEHSGEGGASGSFFAPVKLHVPYAKKGEGISARWQITLGHIVFGGGFGGVGLSPGRSIQFRLKADLTLQRGSTAWRYSFDGSIEPSDKPETATVWSANRSAALEIAVRPDGQKKGNIGVGLKLAAGGVGLECKRGEEPVEAHVEIRRGDGTVVHRADATLDTFVFG